MLPVVQLVHTDNPTVGAKVPIEHKVGVLIPVAPLKVPSRDEKQIDRLVVLPNDPTGQILGVVMLVDGQKNRTEHGQHDVCEVKLAKVPIAH